MHVKTSKRDKVYVYAESMQDSRLHVATPIRCPVSGELITDANVMLSNSITFSGGQRVSFCSRHCRSSFSQLPDRFLQCVDQHTCSEGETTCPVANVPIFDGVKMVLRGGQKIEFCCQGCIATFVKGCSKFQKRKWAQIVPLDSKSQEEPHCHRNSRAKTSHFSHYTDTPCQGTSCSERVTPQLQAQMYTPQPHVTHMIQKQTFSQPSAIAMQYRHARSISPMRRLQQPENVPAPLSAPAPIPKSTHHNVHFSATANPATEIKGSSGPGALSGAGGCSAGIGTSGPPSILHQHTHYERKQQYHFQLQSSIADLDLMIAATAAASGTATAAAKAKATAMRAAPGVRAGGCCMQKQQQQQPTLIDNYHATSNFNSNPQINKTSQKTTTEQTAQPLLSSAERKQRMLKRQAPARKLKCPFCSKTYSSSSNLNRHKLTHTSECKPFACTICEKRFWQRGNLKQHMRTHSGERPFLCETCGKTFRQYAALSKHTRKFPHHVGRKRSKKEAWLDV
mmetsp:Transcript_26302/g.46643  ORF Transcript_26302/g.46643 Transcript_26302/m.46643 type:complete len:509 (+) Transcript_26302:301-1827(+)